MRNCDSVQGCWSVCCRRVDSDSFLFIWCSSHHCARISSERRMPPKWLWFSRGGGRPVVRCWQKYDSWLTQACWVGLHRCAMCLHQCSLLPPYSWSPASDISRVLSWRQLPVHSARPMVTFPATRPQRHWAVTCLYIKPEWPGSKAVTF